MKKKITKNFAVLNESELPYLSSYFVDYFNHFFDTNSREQKKYAAYNSFKLFTKFPWRKTLSN